MRHSGRYSMKFRGLSHMMLVPEGRGQAPRPKARNAAYTKLAISWFRNCPCLDVCPFEARGKMEAVRFRNLVAKLSPFGLPEPLFAPSNQSYRELDSARFSLKGIGKSLRWGVQGHVP